MPRTAAPAKVTGRNKEGDSGAVSSGAVPGGGMSMQEYLASGSRRTTDEILGGQAHPDAISRSVRPSSLLDLGQSSHKDPGVLARRFLGKRGRELLEREKARREEARKEAERQKFVEECTTVVDPDHILTTLPKDDPKRAVLDLRLSQARSGIIDTQPGRDYAKLTDAEKEELAKRNNVVILNGGDTFLMVVADPERGSTVDSDSGELVMQTWEDKGSVATGDWEPEFPRLRDRRSDPKKKPVSKTIEQASYAKVSMVTFAESEVGHSETVAVMRADRDGRVSMSEPRPVGITADDYFAPTAERAITLRYSRSDKLSKVAGRPVFVYDFGTGPDQSARLLKTVAEAVEAGIPQPLPGQKDSGITVLGVGAEELSLLPIRGINHVHTVAQTEEREQLPEAVDETPILVSVKSEEDGEALLNLSIRQQARLLGAEEVAQFGIQYVVRPRSLFRRTEVEADLHLNDEQATSLHGLIRRQEVFTDGLLSNDPRMVEKTIAHLMDEEDMTMFAIALRRGTEGYTDSKTAGKTANEYIRDLASRILSVVHSDEAGGRTTNAITRDLITQDVATDGEALNEKAQAQREALIRAFADSIVPPSQAEVAEEILTIPMTDELALKRMTAAGFGEATMKVLDDARKGLVGQPVTLVEAQAAISTGFTRDMDPFDAAVLFKNLREMIDRAPEADREGLLAFAQRARENMGPQEVPPAKFAAQIASLIIGEGDKPLTRTDARVRLILEGFSGAVADNLLDEYLGHENHTNGVQHTDNGSRVAAPVDQA